VVHDVFIVVVHFENKNDQIASTLMEFQTF
jgi:hypothetical protein